MTARRGTLRALHRTVGLGVALLVLLQAATGVIWVNQDTLTPLLHPEARLPPTSARAPLDDMFKSLAALRPQAKLDRLAIPKRPGSAVVARLALPDGKMEVALLDPSDGRVLSQGPLPAYPEQFAERLHTNLMLGARGRWIVFGEALTLVILAITGVLQWWPGSKRLRSALVVNLKAPPLRRLRDLHAIPGALAAAMFVIVGLTGALMAAETQTSALVRRVAPMAPEIDFPSPARPSGPTVMTAEQALRALQARFPGERLTKILTPGGEDAVIVAVFDRAKPGRPTLADAAALDRTSGAMIVLMDPALDRAGDRFIAWLAPIHSGGLFGPLKAAAATAGGLALATMAATGLANWIARRRARTQRPRTAA